MRLEKNIQRIPMPRSHNSTKQAFLKSFLADAAPVAPPAFPVLTQDTIPPIRVVHGGSLSKKRRWITGLAAGVVFGIGWLIMRL